jgi:SWI/SNF-related matrix-associated actin-dependent regulator 1 of chromatin subfamily A
MFEYQVEGTAFLKANRKAFLLDEPGLGKTKQNLDALDPNLPTLVICPKSAKQVWTGEVKKWTKLTPVKVDKKTQFVWPTAGSVVITNVELMPKEIIGAPSQIQLVVDECHGFKNPATKKAILLNALSRYVSSTNGSIWFSTGTPILTSPMDLWGLIFSMDLIPETYKTWESFKALFKGYDVPINRFVKITKFPSTPKPGALDPIKKFVLRRQKKDVLPNLPTKIYETYNVEIEPEEEITLTEEELESGNFNPTPAIATWRKATSLRKCTASFEYLFDLSENESIVIFSAFRDTVQGLSAGFAKFGKPCETITGESTAADREAAVKTFMESRKPMVLAGTLGAMSVGLTLTKARRVIFIERDWTPAINLQAEDRVCRIGQDRGVIITDIIAKDKADEMVQRVLLRKQKLLENTTDLL